MTPEYIAGFFDGEGCVSTFSQPRRITRIAISMTQKRPEVLHQIQEYLGYGKVYPNHRGSYCLRVLGRSEAKEFIRLVYPHSVVKKPELRLAYELLKLVGSPGCRVSEEDKIKRQILVHKIRELKEV